MGKRKKVIKTHNHILFVNKNNSKYSNKNYAQIILINIPCNKDMFALCALIHFFLQM